MRRAFTLIELLAIVAIIGIMVAASVASVRQGQNAARIRGATRDIFALIRHARSVALVSQEPAIVTYSTVHEDDEVLAKIDVNCAKLMSTAGAVRAQTLEGETVVVGGEEPVADAAVGYGDEAVESGEGESVEDILFAPISSDVVRGIRIKVLMEDEELAEREEARAKPKISVFSNVDYLIGRFREAKREEAEKAKAAEEESAPVAAAVEEDQAEVSVVWEVNGRTTPHRVFVYADGRNPEDGLEIVIDRFGAAKVVSPGEEDER